MKKYIIYTTGGNDIPFKSHLDLDALMNQIVRSNYLTCSINGLSILTSQIVFVRIDKKTDM